MILTLKAVGDAAIVCHNERLADQLDPIVRQLAAFTKKTKKTEVDHAEIARLEFFGGLYMSGSFEVKDGHAINGVGSVPTIPAWNVLRCLQEGAKRHKRGIDVLRGIHPLTEHSTFVYDGPTDPQEMWEHTDPVFALRKSVGVSQKRTMRTRPIFYPWALTLDIEVDPIIFDADTLVTLWGDAGRYAGLGDMRPVYGRFTATIDQSGSAAPKSRAK